MDQKLFQPLQQAWLERWNQRIDTAMQALADIQALAGWDEWSVDRLTTLPRPEREVYVEALLLKSSLLRAQGQTRQSSVMLRKILAAHEQQSEPRGFRLLFELGLDHWIDQDLAVALDAFLLAERKARTEEEKVFALSNILWCLEALDLERLQAEQRLEDAILKISNVNQITHVLEQWQAYKLRKEFFQNLSLPSKSFEAKGQSSFFLSWAKSLPYADGQFSASVKPWPTHLWQGSYRARTLAGIWAPSDRSISRISDAIDRLYLWTWLWMANNSSITLEKLQFTLESIVENLDLETEGKENLLLLRNTLAWLSLLEPSLGRNLKKLLNSLSKLQGASYPLLETEFFLIQRLSNTSGPSDLDKLIRRFPIFEKIAKQTQSLKEKNPLLPKLQERLAPLLMVNEKSYHLIVDRLRNEVRVPHLGEVIYSPKLTRLIQELQKSDRVPFSSLLDEHTDPRSIHNLVARLRKITSSKAVSIQRQEVVRGRNWPQALILHPESEVSFALKDISIASPRPRLTTSDAHLQAARALLPTTFTRKELEKHLRVSKATACRMIESWLKAGKVRAEGKAKSILYFWLLNKELTPNPEAAI